MPGIEIHVWQRDSVCAIPPIPPRLRNNGLARLTKIFGWLDDKATDYRGDTLGGASCHGSYFLIARYDREDHLRWPVES